MYQGARSVLLFLAAFAAVHAVAGRQTYRTFLNDQLIHLGTHPSAYSRIIVGPSYVGIQVVPETLDRALAAGGAPSRTFVLSDHAMDGAETLSVLRRLAALGQHFDEIWVDVTNLTPCLFNAHLRLSSRLIDTYDLETAGAALRICHGVLPWRRELDLAADVSRHVLARLLNLEKIGSHLTFNGHYPAGSERSLAWKPPRGSHPSSNVDERAFLAQRRLLAGAVSAPYRLDAGYERMLRELGRQARRSTTNVTFLIAPVSMPARDALAGMRTLGYPTLSFDDPDRFPELYEPAVRYDMNHLNDAGAEVYSRALAKAYLNEHRRTTVAYGLLEH